MPGRVTIGKNFRAYNHIVIRGPGEVIIGDHFSCRKTMLKNPIILTHSLGATVIIGDGNSFGGTQISCVNRVEVGSELLLANTFIADSNILPHTNITVDAKWLVDHSAPVKIGNHCWLGMNSIVLKGVAMGDESVLSAGSVLIKDAEAYSLLIGNPARKIGTTREVKSTG